MGRGVEVNGIGYLGFKMNVGLSRLIQKFGNKELK
jgi:hypothetical protein